MTTEIMPAAPTLSCAVDSFVRLSSREGLTATVGGGRYKVPAPPGATPAAAIVANPVTARALVMAFEAASGPFSPWFTNHIVNMVMTHAGAAIVVTNDATTGDAPTLPEVAAAQARHTSTCARWNLRFHLSGI